MRAKADALARIREQGLIPIIRTPSADQASRVADVIVNAGARIIEITMGVPNALEVIERVVTQYGSTVLVGAGTVLDADVCRRAVAAGAEFIVAPNLDVQVLGAARDADVTYIPGALTPTEVLAAHRAGADMVKIFPCGPVGGPQYIRALRGPLPHIELVPTGGIVVDNVREFIHAGVTALGVGGEIVNPTALHTRDFESIGEKAREFLNAVRHAKGEPTPLA